MRKETKQFEKRFIRTRTMIERKGLRMIRKALIVQYKSVIEHLRNTEMSNWDATINTMSEAPIRKFYNEFYPMFARLGLMNRKQMMGQKAAEDTFYEGVFAQKLQDLIKTKVGANITSITGTSKKHMLSEIRNIISESETEGLGIEKIKEKILSQFGKNLSGNIVARARAIAQTETIGASNEAAMMAAHSTNLPFKKFWSTSGLPDVRDSHVEMQQYSLDVGGLPPDELFPNGLMQPGDQSGAAAEVINCRCTLLTEIN